MPTVMVVDDAPLTRSTLKRLLVREGYEAVTASDGSDALQKLQAEIVPDVTRYAIETHSLPRVFAVPFESNTPSCRVLEHAGYTLEARLHRSAIKDGRIVDQLQYAFVP